MPAKRPEFHDAPTDVLDPGATHSINGKRTRAASSCARLEAESFAPPEEDWEKEKRGKGFVLERCTGPAAVPQQGLAHHTKYRVGVRIRLSGKLLKTPVGCCAESSLQSRRRPALRRPFFQGPAPISSEFLGRAATATACSHARHPALADLSRETSASRSLDPFVLPPSACQSTRRRSAAPCRPTRVAAPIPPPSAARAGHPGRAAGKACADRAPWAACDGRGAATPAPGCPRPGRR